MVRNAWCVNLRKRPVYSDYVGISNAEDLPLNQFAVKSRTMHHVLPLSIPHRFIVIGDPRCTQLFVRFNMPDVNLVNN